MIRICVIGAGATGLACVKILLEQEEVKRGQWVVVAFEAREDIGGVWLPAPPNADPPLTPLYDSLTTNLPHPFMAYPSFPTFPPSTLLYPSAFTVLEYLKSYSKEFGLKEHIRFGCKVEHIEWNGDEWEVSITSALTSVADITTTKYQFDRIIVANGRFRVPRIPTDILGLKSWQDAGKVSHSVWYRNPNAFRDKVVVVVGKGASGSDISAEIGSVAAKLIHSTNHKVDTAGATKEQKGRITTMDEDGSTVHFEDGTSIQGIDHVVFATGYEDSMPFMGENLLRQGLPDPVPNQLSNSSWHIFPLARHIFPLLQSAPFPLSTLAFMGLPRRLIPFQLSEVQARVIAEVFRRPSLINIKESQLEIQARYDRISEKVGSEDPLLIAKEWHVMRGDEQFEYRDALLEWAGLPGWRAEEWVSEIYAKKNDLKKIWKAIVKRGEAESCVRGVGQNGGVEEWVELMRGLLTDESQVESS